MFGNSKVFVGLTTSCVGVVFGVVVVLLVVPHHDVEEVVVVSGTCPHHEVLGDTINVVA